MAYLKVSELEKVASLPQVVTTGNLGEAACTNDAFPHIHFCI